MDEGWALGLGWLLFGLLLAALAVVLLRPRR
ncbi:hypothetical protein SAMN05216199_2007 [Pedococcus cremeus]|uniref:Uncharacterized protein n=1 Tax=Pedococcus cremeus TaxID=587636 RepID=A0A1H9ULY4_9MICO|nr:hypothetical protein SAMN05216199_2007 [Pedococcus cremeus]